MYLKSIEVQGFKSFANRILFEFPAGITGIVGPNGSGKSNVADAVRWVLGEQRVKQLRGGSMQDVIFSGTENRKPLSYAAVAITFDNSDHKLQTSYEEVTITRKLFRSGESAYLLNGKSCRLKDIQFLFYDTGIGKDGYSIIGQGQIDRILSGRPEERREIFDEAAGIVKFKRRKELSEKKLENEQQNLTRVNDILSELSRQVEPLQKQSEKAKKYLDFRDELKVLEINEFLAFEDAAKEKEKTLSENLAALENEKDETEKNFEKEKAFGQEKESEREALSALEEKTLREENAVRLRKQEIAGHRELFEEQMRSMASLRKESRRLLDGFSDKEERLLENQKKVLAERGSLKEALNKSHAEEEEALQRETEAGNRILETEHKIEEARTRLMDLLEGRSRTRGRLERLCALKDQAEAEKAALQSKLIELKSTGSEKADALLEAQKNQDALKKTISEKEAQLLDISNRIKDTSQTGQEKKNALQDASNNYHKLISRLETLKNMAERYEGFGYSVKRVMEVSARYRGVHGVVADLFQIDAAYEVAVETALGGSMQNIVTEDEACAKALIEYLKKNRYGRATFLPLSSVRKTGSFRFPEALKEEGAVGLASSLVSCDPKYSDILESLLGKTLVCRDLDCAIRIARKYRQSIRIVTPQGDLINPGGSMTGGAFKNASNLLSRKRELREMEERSKKLLSIMEDLKVQTEDEKAKKHALYTEMDAQKETLRGLRIQESENALILKGLENEGHNARNTVEAIRREAEKLTEKQKEIEDSRLSIEVELKVSEEMEKKLNADKSSLENSLLQLREEKESASGALKKVEMKNASVTQKNIYLSDALERLKGELSACQEEQKHLLERLSEADEEEKRIEKERTLLEAETKTLDAQLKVYEEKCQTLKKDLEDIRKAEKASIERRENSQKRLGDLKGEEIRLQERIEGLTEKRDKKIAYMWDKYEITYHAALPFYDSSLPEGTPLKEKIRAVKGQMKALGNVNVGAVEEYREVSERHAFLSKQQEDLVEAEKNLVAIIGELETSMRDQFEEQFVLIQKEFNKVFKVLFGGGAGTLTLMDGDPLVAGIEIIAQPPGKKLQNMMQLSGGEKALTAIALLFAIQNLRPSPFCLLDEIEAALDDNNVDRFAQYLKKLTVHTQFIVITHRRGTMRAADRLYGITMQEKGISTLVSVDLVEDDLTN